MARIRTIKPEFWRNENLSAISPEAALLAIGLLNHSDDDGYFNANEKIIKADIFPLRDLSCSTTVLLQELYDIGYIELYFDEENNCKSRIYGKVVNFSIHQVINKPNKSKIKYLQLLPYSYGSNTVVLPHGKGKGKGKGTGKGKEGEGECLKSSDELKPQKSKKIEGIKTGIPDNFTVSDEVKEWAAKNNFNSLDIHLESFIEKCKQHNYKYVDWDAALKTAIRGDWAKTKGNINGSTKEQEYPPWIRIEA